MHKTKKSTFNFHALFFPATIQAALEKEQKYLRRLFAGEIWSLFSFFPPCIPFSGKISAAPEAALSAGALKAEAGWLYRPAAFFPETAGVIPAAQGLFSENDRSFPAFKGMPSLPKEAALILGFAGDYAELLLEKALRDTEAAANLSTPMKAEVWYCAEMLVFAETEKENALFSHWSEGKPSWKRRGLAFEYSGKAESS